MKTFSVEARNALASGEAIVSGALWLGGTVNTGFWGGFGSLTIDGTAYVGVGDSGLVSVTSGALGTTEQGTQVSLSGVDPEVVSRVDLRSLRGCPVVLYRLIFNGAGSQLLHGAVFLRGRVDRAPVEETPAGTSKITLHIESAARGLGRRSERMRTDADQRLISATDGGLRRVTYAGEKQIYWGGQPPQRAGGAFGGVPGGGGYVGGDRARFDMY